MLERDGERDGEKGMKVLEQTHNPIWIREDFIFSLIPMSWNIYSLKLDFEYFDQT